MRTIRWMSGVICWLTVLPMAASHVKPSSGGRPCRQIVTVLTFNYAGVSSDLLADAQVEAERIFSEANVDINWVDAPTSVDVADGRAEPAVRPQPVLTMKLLSRAMGARLSRPATEFAFATGSTAYVFYDRIDRMRHTAILFSRGKLLGNVLSHEIGHLLLDRGAHASNGLMQPNWYLSRLMLLEQGGLRFTPWQIERLRERLMNESRCED